jgi:hypothetical protein
VDKWDSGLESKSGLRGHGGVKLPEADKKIVAEQRVSKEMKMKL